MGAVPSTTSAVPSATSSIPTTLRTTTTTTTTTTAAAAPTQTYPARYLFNFGDSFTDTGFDITSTWPTQNNPFGNPVWPGHTSCAGPNWLDDMVQSSPSNTLSFNLAMGGATVDNQYAQIWGGGHPFTVQAPTFINSTLTTNPHPASAKWTAQNSYFIVWFGVNDVDATWQLSPPDPNMIKNIMTSYFETVDKLFVAGARNFLFMGIPPLWRAPTWSTNPSVANLTSYCTTWNTYLKTYTARYTHKRPRAHATFLDIQPFFNTVLDDPTAYGAPDSTCMNEDGTSCCWQDGVHPSQAIHTSVAGGVRALLDAKGFFPAGEPVTAPLASTEQGQRKVLDTGAAARQALFEAEVDACKS